ncbi:NAD-dependent epimerase/dehydratase family protein [Amylibacter sp.]|nr:NAD-dependent epimerase/dehydratase family protein [Amylibacter sp.]MDC0982642.1 NAD-dependent epimerase/dehydratase family protein [Amylibacter sp.]
MPIISKELCNKTIGITGYSGYIGQHLVKSLKNAGCNILLIPRLGVKKTTNSNGLPECEWNTPTDLANQLKSIENLVLVNLAGFFINNHTYNDLPKLIDANLNYPLNIIEALVDSPHKNIINIGTSWEYTDTGIPNPYNLYANLKAANASALKWYASRYPICVTNLKLNDTYGGLDTRPKLMPLLKKKIENMEVVNLRNASQKINLLHITDVIEGISSAILENTKLQSHSTHTAFLLASETTTLSGLIKKINVDLGIKLDAIFENYNEDLQDLRGIWEAAPRLKNWSPRISLNNGLHNYLGKNNEF